MRFIVNKQIFDDYPGLQIGVLVAQGVTNKQGDTAAYDKLKQVQSEFNRAINKSLLNHHPQILAWREAYRKFGAKPKSHLSSIENLGSRIVKGGEIRSINTLVDLYNSISLKYMLPAGGEDLDTLQGNLRLDVAGDNEPEALLLGEKEARAPQPGEIFYTDDQGAVCRRWNWKEADRTKLTSGTTNAVLVLESLPPVHRGMLQDALNDLGYLIQHFCGGQVSSTIIDTDNPEVVLKKDGSYQQFEPLKKVSDTAWDPYHLATAQEELSDESKVRIEKVEKMRAQGIEPWPASKNADDTCADVLKQFETEKQKKKYTLAGRVLSVRWHGKAAFIDIQDRTGRLQVHIRGDILSKEQFSFFKQFVDIGDIVWITGTVFKTKMGEVTIEASDYTLLSKSIHPLPEKFHGLTHVETRYRQRYLDLISNPESKKKFMCRSRIMRSMRTFLNDHDFVEVETPMLHPIAGGATARPFITHHNAFDSSFYLRIAPELYLKRLVVGSIDRVYEINRNFRNEGVSTKHNPEFTMAEFYMAHHDYHFIMGFVENMIRAIIKESCESLAVPFGDQTIDFGKPFTRMTVHESVIKIGGISEKHLSESEIDTQIKKYHIHFDQKNPSYGQKVFALFEELVESKLIQPTFITDYPIEISPLAKRDANNSDIAARYELFIGGMEISNGFNELNDPFDQAERFKQQVEAHKAGDAEAHQYDADYVKALEYALPPTVGVGIGIDRLTMLATNTTSIKDVILFPTLKKK